LASVGLCLGDLPEKRLISPDCHWTEPVTPSQDSDTAPLNPPTLGGVAQANVPNTLYAHVWNLGIAPAYRVRVEFYWFNPSLGISRADANLVGAAWVDLANRFTLYPKWVEVKESYRYLAEPRVPRGRTLSPELDPHFREQGHECLVVRVFEPLLDSQSESIRSLG
jgi:hypothetical protein